MGLITKVISQKYLDLEYNKAKILASPYDYKLSERIMLRSSDEMFKHFNIFGKTNRTEWYLNDKLDLHDTPFMKLNPDLGDMSVSDLVGDIRMKLSATHRFLGLCGNIIKYNNLNISEDILLKDLCYAGMDICDATIEKLRTKNYLKALEVWHLKGVSTSSLIPNLMYLSTEYDTLSLSELENLKFAEDRLKTKDTIVMPNIASAEDDENIFEGDLLGLPAYLLPVEGYCSYDPAALDSLKTIENPFYKLSLSYALSYGAELLYYFNNIKDDEIKNALEDLLSIGYKENTFCSKYLYQIDSFGHVVINSEIQECFYDNNEIRFLKIRNYFMSMLSSPDMSKNIVANYNEFVLPIFFMRMVLSMHAYAYQIARIKHITLLYKTAKEAGVITKEEFNSEVGGLDTGYELWSSDRDSEDTNTELLNLDTFSDFNDSPTNFEDTISKEKTVGKDKTSTAPALTAADMLKKDLQDSKYTYDVKYVKNEVSNKDTYNTIASNIKLITHELTKQIKEIKTYNVGGKQGGLLAGKLDKKNLWKYKSDPHIFYNNNYKLKEMDLAFGCILDESGSMWGEKIKNGRIVMIMLHEVLNSLGINHSIIGHTSSGMYQSRIYKYYQFKEEAHYTLEKPYGLVKADSRSGNCDSGALFYMQSVMKQVRNKDKIVIIFSDGEPTECTDLDLTEQVKAMEKSGIHVIGVGVNFESIKEYYPDNANGKNLKEMVDIVVSILKRYVLEKKEG